MKRAKSDPEDLAQGSARSPHAFMLEALDAKARRVEQRRVLLRAALAAERDALDSNQGFCASGVDAYFEARAAEKRAPLPSLHTWRK